VDPWTSDAPFTKEQVDGFNRYTHFPSDINKEFGRDIQEKEENVKNTLTRYGMEEPAEEIKKALWYYRKALYEYFLEVSRARAKAPPPSVVGPANYNYSSMPKADRIRDNASEKLGVAKQYLERALNRNTKGRTDVVLLKQRQDEYGDMFRESKNRVEFGKKYAEWEKRKIELRQKNGEQLTGWDLQQLSGNWDHVRRQQGRTMYDLLSIYAKEESQKTPESKDLSPVLVEIPQKTEEKPPKEGILTRELFYSDERKRTGAIHPEGIGGTLPTKLAPFWEHSSGHSWIAVNPYTGEQSFFNTPEEAKKRYDEFYDEYVKMENNKKGQVDLFGDSALLTQKYIPPKQIDIRKPTAHKPKAPEPGQTDLSGSYQGTLFVLGGLAAAILLTKLAQKESG
jgi:hypothetical protein